MTNDFTNCLTSLKFYGGSNGKKICIQYNDELYMLKFPARKDVDRASYSNNVFSEYVACHIFALLGFKTQETLLGVYNVNGEAKSVCACKDFACEDREFYDFASLKNSLFSSSSNGYGVELSEVLNAILEQSYIPVSILKDYFWDMFIVDSLLGNFDRHNGNWGFLKEKGTNKIEIAPIFDCGSCLLPQATDEMLKEYLEDTQKLEERVYSFPNSALRINNIKINPYEFITSLENDDCNEALKRIYPQISLDKINKIIDETPIISDVRKEFYKTYIAKRYNLILKVAYDNLN